MASDEEKLREINERAKKLRDDAEALSAEIHAHLHRLERNRLHVVPDQDEEQSA